MSVLPCGAAIAQRVYVTNSGDNTVSVIDTSVSPAVVIGSAIAVGAYPLGIAMAPGGGVLYVANFFGPSLSVVDLQTDPPQNLATISLPNNASDVVASADGNRAYVAYDSGVAVIDATVTPPVILTSLAVEADHIALSPDGHTAYVSQFNGNSVAVIDVTTTPPTIVGSAIGVGSEPLGMALSANGATLYVANQADGTVSVIDTTASPPAVTRTIALGINDPNGLAISPDGTTVYVGTGTDSIGVIDVSVDPPVVSAVVSGNDPSGLAVSPDGAQVFATNQVDGTVSIIATATNTVAQTLAVGSHPYAVAYGPTPPPLAPSATTLTASRDPAIAGWTFEATATVVSPTAELGGPAVPPTGTVVISDGTASCTATLANPVTARNSGACSLALASAGMHVLTATYSGDTVYRASSGTLNEEVVLPPPEPTPTLSGLALLLLAPLLCVATLIGRRRRRA